MPASLFTIALFFVYTWGLGFSLTRLVRESENFLERNIMRVGFGLSAFIVLGIVLNTLRVSLDYRVFLLLSVAVPLYFLIFKEGYRQLSHLPSVPAKVTLSNLINVCVLIIFFASLFMYVSGAFKYPFLEDDDPWGHASAVKYVSIEKTAFPLSYYPFHYMDPYPPGYDMTFGILHQTSPSMSWTIKFFNAFFIALSLVFFYFFAKQFLNSRAKALFSTFVLASVPAYLSHFIWAPALAMAVFFQTMYAFEMIRNDKRWWVVAGICLASILLVHPTHAVKLSGFIAIYLGIKALSSFVADRKSWLKLNIDYAKAVVLGIILSLFWWALKWKAFANAAKGGFKGGAEAATATLQGTSNILSKFFALITKALNPNSGTATRAYTLRDFVVVHSQNMINNPVGLGLVVSILALAGFLSFAAESVKHLPRPKVVALLAVVLCIFLAAIIASNTLEFQKEFYEEDQVARPYAISQNWANPPSYAGVFALSLVLVSLAAAFLLSLVSVVVASHRSGSSSGSNSVEGVSGTDSRPIFIAILLGWLLFAFLGVNNKTFNLPVGLFAFRFWMILAIPVALIAAEGFFSLLNAINLFRLDKATATTAKVILIAIVVAGVLFTSAKQKYDVNTACWPAGAFWSGELVLDQESGCVTQSEVITFSWLMSLPTNTRVFTFSSPDQVIGFDKYSCGWCKPEYDMKKRFYNITPVELHSFMRDNNYDYFIIGGIDTKTYSFNSTLAMIDAVASSGLFTVANQGQSAIIFRPV
ncbi:hypothetical protein HYV83_00380 [Candidatus Woesearchaeota archaeon]|nr:hypothetical protein [Candidatus Woesearchaeota archaeon]